MAINWDDPNPIDAFALLALKGKLSLEVKGLHGRGRSAYSVIKQMTGLKGSKQKVLDAYCQLLREKGVLQ